MFVPLLAVPLAVQLVADGMPKFDVSSSCKGAVAAGYLGPEKSRLQNCLDSEERTRAKLDQDWTSFPAADRSFCVTSIAHFSPTYTELATCLEMRRDLKNSKPAGGDSASNPPSTRAMPRR